MPLHLVTDDGMTSIRSKLDGDTLTVHPITFARMQECLASALGTETGRAADALRAAGLTAEEIASRLGCETKIVVDASLASHIA